MSVALLGRRFTITENTTDRNTGQQTPTERDLFIADIAVSQSHSLGGSVTTHSVERGVDIADHVICEAAKLTLEMEVSNTPQFCNRDSTRRRPVVSTGNRPDSFRDQGFPETNNRIESAYQALRTIRCERRVFDVQTKLHLYKNMVIESLDVSQDADTNNVMRFTANLVEVNIVGAETTRYKRFKNKNKNVKITRGIIDITHQKICSVKSDFAYCGCLELPDGERDECRRKISYGPGTTG
ncbi:MAG: phage baseplate protein [Maricaulaceae bacterium]